jgi:hypothetical protein
MATSKINPALKMLCAALWLALASSARAGSQGSADYSSGIESNDGGGSRAASADYSGASSFGAGNLVASADYAQRGGYAGQLPNAPVAGLTTIYRTAGTRLLISLANVTNNWADVDGSRIFLAGMNLVTANNVHLTTNATFIFYTNSPNVNDQITYAIRDAQGESAAGVISVTVVTNMTGQSQGIVVGGNGTATAQFSGIPGFNYSVQRSTNLVNWVTVLATNAPPSGLFQFTDTFSDLGGNAPVSAYYRLSWSP